jgi:hypothetical protein
MIGHGIMHPVQNLSIKMSKTVILKSVLYECEMDCHRNGITQIDGVWE